MGITAMILIMTILFETVFAFLTVQGIRKKRAWMIIVFSILFVAVPFIVFYVFGYGITLM